MASRCPAPSDHKHWPVAVAQRNAPANATRARITIARDVACICPPQVLVLAAHDPRQHVQLLSVPLDGVLGVDARAGRGAV